MEQGAKRYQVTASGLGGQGVLTIGKLLARAGMLVYRNAVYFPNYGPKMRTDECECSVTLSDDPIWAPGILEPQAAIVMGPASLARFEGRVQPGGILIVDSSVVSGKISRTDLRSCYCDAGQVAMAAGSHRASNMVLLGAYVEASKVIPLEVLEQIIQETMGSRSESLVQLNKEALRQGAEYMARCQGSSVQAATEGRLAI